MLERRIVQNVGGIPEMIEGGVTGLRMGHQRAVRYGLFN